MQHKIYPYAITHSCQRTNSVVTNQLKSLNAVAAEIIQTVAVIKKHKQERASYKNNNSHFHV